MFDEAIEEAKTAVQLSGPERRPLINLGVAYAGAGKRAEAENILNGAMERSKREYVPSTNFVNLYAALGEKGKALDWLERAFEDDPDISLFNIKVEPRWDVLRSEPRFVALLEKMGLDN